MQKYLKITQEDFHKVCEILHRVRNSFCSALISQGLLNFAQGVKSIFHSFALCPTACTPFGHFAQPCEIVGCQISSLILFLAYLIDLAKATKLSKTWILHVFELHLASPWIIHNSLSLLACFNDKKAFKNTKTCQKLISNTCKGP